MKTKVLIVDDDVAITQQLFWMLCDDYEVTTANDLASAIRRTTIYEPAVVLLDLNLPPTLDAPDSGMRVLQYIKGHFAAAKVFIISSASNSEMQNICLEGGADGFFSKPLEIENLLATVRRTALARHLGAA
ncbi:MAG TPA: response regulator [Pyrinomonadaceae bacterium]|nr:response regulator [Pyrinomonadaceae bacterium]